MPGEREQTAHEAMLRHEDRLALLSTLQELTLSALQLFDPDAPVSDFMFRLAERIQSAVALCLEAPSGSDQVRVLGGAGLSRASLNAAPPIHAGAPGAQVDWAAIELPFVELEGMVARWVIPLPSASSDDPSRALFLFFKREPLRAMRMRRMVERVGSVLETAFCHRFIRARLLEQTTLLEAQQEASIEGILIASTDQRVMSSNPHFRELWGFDKLSPGARLAPVFQGAAELTEAPEAFLELIARVREHSNEVRTQEVRLRNGRTLECHTAPVRDTEGHLYGRGWYFRDITERKQAEEDRLTLLEQERKARASAEEAVQLRDDFLSAAAHELKTPMTTLGLRLAAAERSVQKVGQVDLAQLERARWSLKKLAGLVDDLLNLSRVQSGRLDIHLQPLELGRFLHDVVDGFQPLSPDHRIVLEDTAEPVVRADPLRLEQVLTNLLENAVKYSPSGGTIRVRASSRGDEAVFSVTDQGIGIPADEQRLLFQRFFRARNAPVTRFGGLGLGLFISRNIVERHGGRIWVESEVGKGSTFHVALPLALLRDREVASAREEA